MRVLLPLKVTSYFFTAGSPDGDPVDLDILNVGNGASLVPMMKVSLLAVEITKAICSAIMEPSRRISWQTSLVKWGVNSITSIKTVVWNLTFSCATKVNVHQWNVKPQQAMPNQYGQF